MPSIRRHGAGYQARYRDPAGRQRGKTFRTKREASSFLARVEADKQRGTFVDPQLSRVRFEDWAAEWWETSTSHLKPRTREGYLSLLRRYLVPTFGRYPLQAITPPQVKSFIAALDRQGMSASRQRQTYRLLSMILKAAVEAGCLGRSPCIGVKIKRHQPPEQVILTPEQVGILAGALGTPNDLLCYVLAFGGLRWGEAAALRRSRCDVTRSRVQVVESLAEVGGRLHFGPTKTYSRRWVRLPKSVAQTLGQHLARIVRADPTALVFTSPQGGPLRSPNFRRRVWNPAVHLAGEALPDGLTPHHLRHSCASLLIQQGASVKAVQQQLGHSTPTVTLNVYAHLFEDDLEGLYQGLDERLESIIRPSDVAKMWPSEPSR